MLVLILVFAALMGEWFFSLLALVGLLCLWSYTHCIEEEIRNYYQMREQAMEAREQIQHDLQVSEELFRTLFMEMDQGAIIQNKEYRLEMANPAAFRILCLPEHAIGTVGDNPNWKVVDEEGMPLPFESYPSMIALRTGKPVRKSVIGMMPPSASKYTWLMLDCFPQRDSSGEVIKVFSTITDITDLKESERALRNERLILEEIFENAHIGYWDVDLSTGTEYYSPTFKSMLGYRPEELNDIKEVWRILIYPEDLPRLDDALNTHIHSKGKSSLYLELRYRHKKGHCVWVICAGKVIHWDDAGNPIRAIGCHIDITARKRAEEERNRIQERLANMQKLESISRLAGGVAHDSNNLLQLILGHAEMALKEAQVPDSAIFHLKGIQDAAQRSAKLTQQLLAFARKQVILPRILNINEVVDECIPLLKQLLGNRIELEWQPEDDLGQVLADPTQINQILTNLCTNARDAIQDKGKVVIQTRNVYLDTPPIAKIKDFRSGMYVMLSVSDDGVGIPPEILARIFEPFFTTRQAGQGTGLGLATVYGIIKQNQGIIDVISNKDLGSTFNIYLPFFEQEDILHLPLPEQTVRQPLVPAQSGQKTILLVEDEREILRLASTILESEGYRVIAATQPSEAISLFERNPTEFDLVISDVVMPGMNGSKLLEHLRKTRKGIPGLLMSGYPMDAVSAQKNDLHFLKKPFTTQELLQRVHSLTGVISSEANQI